ncbi:class I SAM-dependent methyltransferase [Halalkalicoccus tibetensis]|uniref:Class I SAM-dependent methyltransferase n=1 Tax=Halalkalicoccus tibetensis TaxID=175632 RepID=A0ABD5V6G2_9EURY
MNPDEIHQEWAERSGEYSPTYYAYRGPDEASELIRDALDSRAGPEPSVLELGCSSGRHLSFLYEHGYTDLAGIEVNGEALSVMGENYPELAAAGTFHLDTIENAIREFEDDAFDAVFSVETLQHIHPDNEWVFDEIARITSGPLVTVENEGEDGDDVNYVNDEFPLYYRDWRRVFAERGFREADSKRLKRDTFRLFRPE